MFSWFKSQFIWRIICTFLTGFICGSTITMIDLHESLKTIAINGVFSIIGIICTVIYWKIIFHKLDLQDKINSIYTDID